MAVNTYSWNANTNVATNSAYRSWGLAVSTALQAIGLVKTSDTGQVDWTTVDAPGAAWTLQGDYEIYRLDDALQATYPIFIRVEYGAGASATHRGIGFIIGTGTNGSGTLTGATLGSDLLQNTSSYLFSSGSSSTNATPSFASGNGEFFCVLLDPTIASSHAGCGFGFERSRDSDGNITGDGYTFWAFGTVNSLGRVGGFVSATRSGQYCIRSTIPQSYNIPTSINTFDTTVTSPAIGTNRPHFYKIPATMPNGKSWIMKSILQPGGRADATMGAFASADVDGAGTCTYRTLPCGSAGLFVATSVAYSVMPAIRWS